MTAWWAIGDLSEDVDPSPDRPAPTLGAVVDGVDALRVLPCSVERADDVHRLTQAAFAPHRHLDPPSGAASESVASVIDALAAGGGAVAEQRGQAVGCLRWRPAPEGDLYVGRVAVDPALHDRGIGRVLMAWAEGEARRRRCDGVAVAVRVALPDNLDFFQRLGYRVTGEHRHQGYAYTTYLSLRKDLHQLARAAGE